MRLANLVRSALANAIGCGLLAISLASPAFAQSCALNSPSSKIKHVVYVEFDNVHFTRDNPNVPSDLEQIPNLLNFITSHGTLDAGDHTVLISHTSNDILTTQTGLYSDDDGIFIGNSFGVFETPTDIVFPASFFYWTNTVSDILGSGSDTTYALTTPEGKNVPAPWVPFTRAGCDVGAFSTANIVLENANFDVSTVFGSASTQAAESKSAKTNDFLGAAIHCAIGSKFCTAPNGAAPDLLPDEPAPGYAGYSALFGLKYVAPALGGLTDYNGNPITGFGNIDFDPTPAQTLAVVETMLKQGVPVVFAYVADAHDNHEGASLSSEATFGPGEQPYVKQLADYNAAFGTFFSNLAADGITADNTLFVFTPDEGDHFVGNAPSPANCDGAKIVGGVVTPDVYCTYGTNGVGELDINLAGLTALTDPTTYEIHFDDSATTYVIGQPDPASSTVRQLERTMAGLSAVNPHTGNSESLIGNGLGPDLQGALVDPAAMKLIHMNTVADPNREPTFTFFGNPNFFFETSGSTTPVVGTGFAWNHGDIQPEIARTFIAIAGPGVRNLGVTTPADFFTDHVDLRPTMMFLLGLPDDYQHDGRVITELVDPGILPPSMKANFGTLEQLGQVYKQIDAPFGTLSENTLKISTFALESDTPGDVVYNNLENIITSWTNTRNNLTSQIKSMVEAAEFQNIPINEFQANRIILDGSVLLLESDLCSANPAICSLF